MRPPLTLWIRISSCCERKKLPDPPVLYHTARLIGDRNGSSYLQEQQQQRQSITSITEAPGAGYGTIARCQSSNRLWISLGVMLELPPANSRCLPLVGRSRPPGSRNGGSVKTPWTLVELRRMA